MPSYRKVSDHIEQFFGVRVHYSTILRWIDKYTRFINAYVEDFKPDLSSVWHVNEMMIKTVGSGAGYGTSWIKKQGFY